MRAEISANGFGLLTGVRVLDLTIALAGPYGTRALADLGAEVIKVDTRAGRDYATDLDVAARIQAMYPNGDPGLEPWNRAGSHGQLNRNKKSVALDLGSPEGRVQFLRLVESADCVVENFTPKVMPSLGLGQDVLREVNPKLVYVAMPGFGSSGPRSTFPAFAPTTEAASGFLSLLGYEDGTLVPNPMSLADFVGGLNAIVGLMSALWSARRTGEGAFVDLSQVEAMSSFIGEEFERDGGEEALVSERPVGNQLPGTLLSGMFPARGFDEWIAISMHTESQLSALAGLAEMPERIIEWLEWVHSDDGRGLLRAELGEWTCRFGKQDLAATLQSAGVPAAPVQTAPDLFADPQLSHLGFFVEIDDPVVGRLPYEGQPWHFGHRTNQIPLSPAPRIGSDTTEIVAKLGPPLGDGRGNGEEIEVNRNRSQQG